MGWEEDAQRRIQEQSIQAESERVRIGTLNNIIEKTHNFQDKQRAITELDKILEPKREAQKRAEIEGKNHMISQGYVLKKCYNREGEWRELWKKKGPCFVATVVYGDPNAPEVQALRDVRDNVLMKSLAGRTLVRAYYSGLGESTANIIRDHLPSTIPLIKKGLDYVAKKDRTSKRL